MRGYISGVLSHKVCDNLLQKLQEVVYEAGTVKGHRASCARKGGNAQERGEHIKRIQPEDSPLAKSRTVKNQNKLKLRIKING